MGRQRPRAGYRPRGGRGRGAATQWPQSEGSTVHRIAPLVTCRARVVHTCMAKQCSVAGWRPK
eukprot:2845482-Pleurochrysis_carterae.AAC.1